MSSKRYTSEQRPNGRVIFDNLDMRYVSSTATGNAAPAVTADVNKAEVWTVWTEQERATFKGVLKELNKQLWLKTGTETHTCEA